MNGASTAAEYGSVTTPPAEGALPVTRAALALFGFGLAFDNILVPGLGSATNVFAGVLVVMGLWQVVATGRFRGADMTVLLLTGFIAWCGVSMIWAHDMELASTRFQTQVWSLALLWAGWQIAQSPRDVRWMMAGFIAGAVLTSVLAWQSFLGGQIFKLKEGAEEWTDPRYAALGFDPNEMGVSLALTVPMLAYAALSTPRWPRYAAAACLPVILSGIALTGSRGAGISAVVALAVSLFWIGRRSVTVMAVAFMLLVAGTVVVIAAAPDTWARIISARQQITEGGNVGLRAPIWAAGTRVFFAHPVGGAGVGQFEISVVRDLGYTKVAHNTALSVAAELGIPGLLLFFGAFGWLLIRSLSAAVRERELTIGLVLTWLTGMLSLTFEHRRQTWFILLLAAAALDLSRPRSVPADPSAPRHK